LLGLSACEKWLRIQDFGVIHDSYRIIGRQPDLWHPKTWGELFDAYRMAWSFLEERIKELPLDEQQRAAKILLNSAHSLSRIESLQTMIIETFLRFQVQDYVSKQDLLATVTQILRYSFEKDDRIKQPWNDLKEELTGNDFHSLLARYVGMNIVEDNFDEDGNRIDLGLKKIGELAQEGLEKPHVLSEEWKWLVTTEANNGFIFGYELAKRDTGFSFLVTILDTQRKATDNASAYFLSGYMRAMVETDLTFWDQTMEAIAGDSTLSKWIPELTSRSTQISDSQALRVLRVIKENKADIRGLAYFIYGNAVKGLSEQVFCQWIEFLLSTNDLSVVMIALDLYATFYIRGDRNLRMPDELTLRLITHPVFFDSSAERHSHQLSSFHWEQISTTYIEMFPEQSNKVADIILTHFGEENSVFGSYRPFTQRILGIIAQKNPGGIWRKITERLTFPLDSRAFYITHWLRGEHFWNEGDNDVGSLQIFPQKLIWEWVNEDIEQRAWFVASFVLPMLSPSSLAYSLLVQYGDRDDVQRNLIANFSSEGWTGNESAHLQRKIESLLETIKDEANSNVRNWVERYVDSLKRRLEHAKVEEERDNF
jgi:hypothetical protein